MKNERKEELKDEMKNRISMALKDPILQQGFEIICKNLAELEKENKTVSRKANKAIADKLLITAKYNEVLNDLNQENDKVQKENAELKDKLEKETAHRIRNFNKAIEWKEKHRTLKKENAELKTLIKSEHEIEARKNNRLISQLTKAKELLRKLIDYPRIYGQASGRYKHECDLAEQFLKDSEVEK